MSDAHDLPHPNNNNMLITAVLMFHRYKLMEFLFVFGSIFPGERRVISCVLRSFSPGLRLSVLVSFSYYMYISLYISL